MAADLQKYLFKSKFLRKCGAARSLVFVLIVLGYSLVCVEGQECNLACENGRCVEDKCVCDVGWKGSLCQFCEGRVRLGSNSSVISDGSGNYSMDNQCTWLIDSGTTNSSIRVHLQHFSTECSWDHLYIYDGDSIYDPLLAVFSGIVVGDGYKVTHIPEVVAHSGSALLYFYSDAAYNTTGFNIYYRVDGCPSTVWRHNCSGRGVCIDGVCTCDAGWVGEACSTRICGTGNGCSAHGQCDKEHHKCICHQGYRGDDCSQAEEKGWWEVVEGEGTEVKTSTSDMDNSVFVHRSSHTLSVVGDILWILGGYSFTPQPFTYTYNLKDKVWKKIESPSIKKPMSRYGHSAVVHNGSIYMYGGMKENGSITRELWRLDTNTNKWSLMPTNRTPRTSTGSGGGRRGGRRRPNRRKERDEERGKERTKREVGERRREGGIKMGNEESEKERGEGVINRRKERDERGREKREVEERIRGEGRERGNGESEEREVEERRRGERGVNRGNEESEERNEKRRRKRSSQEEEKGERRREKVKRAEREEEEDWEEDTGVNGASEASQNACESSPGPCAPIATVGHAAVIVEKAKRAIMLIIFGHSPRYTYLNTVQEYDIERGTWVTVRSSGALVSGVYGGSATWDPASALVYVHGGLLSQQGTSHVTGALASYDPVYYKWRLLTPAPVPRFLHSAVISAGLLLIFGGNTHNDTAFSYGAKCYSAEFLAYDLACNTWRALTRVPDLDVDVARYGHAAVAHNETVYIQGGFNGKMLGSILGYNLGACEQHSDREACLVAYPGIKCVWNRVLSRCELTHNNDKKAYDVCPNQNLTRLNLTQLCSDLTSCQSCLANTYDCVWCGNSCSHSKCISGKGVRSEEGCEASLRSYCKSLGTCPLCRSHQNCDWVDMSCSPAPNRTLGGPETESGHSGGSGASGRPNHPDLDHPNAAPDPESNPPKSPVHPTNPPIDSPVPGATRSALTPHRPCEKTCSQRGSCIECTEGPCMWCYNRARCVNNDSYLAGFPYGQCREWTTEAKRCMNTEKGLSRCSLHQTCRDCQGDVACGWCDDGSGSGIGVCLEGGQRGPINPETKSTSKKCHAENWYFTICPVCNCNGHSKCINNNNNNNNNNGDNFNVDGNNLKGQCIMPCSNNTVGSHCQYCIDKFFGKPINGGLCTPCNCNEHGDTCNRESGRCNCHTKGVTGDHCERCDTQNNYVGDPLQGSCFYDLQIDYQFTFNLSKIEDRHIRQINFFNVPTKMDVDTDFDIICSKDTKIKISAKTTGSHETWIIRNYTGKRIKRRFSASEYTFGSADNNTTFHVYVYNFTPPIEIVVSFSQHPKLDLIQFFSIFSLCFLVLLTLAAILWKIKQKYDVYTRRQRLLVEMEAMASRPFRPIFLELYPRGDPSSPIDPPKDATQTPNTTGSPPPSLPDSNSNPLCVDGEGTKSQPGTITGGNKGSSKSSSKQAPAPLMIASPTSLPVSTGNSPVSAGILSWKKPVQSLRGCANNGSANNSRMSPTAAPPRLPVHILGSNGCIGNGPVKTCSNGVCVSDSTGGSSPDISMLSHELLHTITNIKHNKKVKPSPIALEPCSGNRAAVLSLLVQLPTGGSSYTPVGHPGGLSVASTLVTLGTPRKCSNEGVTNICKADINKNKATRTKHHSNCTPDTCIRI